MKEEETHNKRFEVLQEEFLKNRNPETLGKMYFLVREIQTNYILDYQRKKGIKFNLDEFEDKVEDATIFVIDKYLKHRDFRIERLSAYAHFGLLKALYKNKEKEMAIKEVSYEDWLEQNPTNWYEQDFDKTLFDEGQG